MNDINCEGLRIRRENITYLRTRPVTEKVVRPLEGTDLDQYTALLARIEDLAVDELKLQRQLKLVQTRKQELWIRVDAINDKRVK
jgi:hypothetical protein